MLPCLEFNSVSPVLKKAVPAQGRGWELGDLQVPSNPKPFHNSIICFISLSFSKTLCPFTHMSKEQDFFSSRFSEVFFASSRQHLLKEIGGTGSQVGVDILSTLEEELNPQAWAHV